MEQIAGPQPDPQSSIWIVSMLQWCSVVSCTLAGLLHTDNQLLPSESVL